MPRISVTQDDLSTAKTRLRANLRLKSSHLSEALAAGLGFRSHIALLASVREAACAVVDFDDESFHRRLVALGHSPNRDHSTAAFMHALYPLPGFFLGRGAIHELVSSCAATLGACEKFIRNSGFIRDAAYGNVPDPTVSTVRIDRDVWRWNPTYIDTLSLPEAASVMLACMAHRQLGHPARRGERDARAWDIACDLVVNHAVISLQIGSPLAPFEGIYFDERFHGGLTAEQVYDKLLASDDGRLRLPANSEQGCWTLPKKDWPSAASSIVTAGKAEGLRGGSSHHSNFGECARMPSILSGSVTAGKAILRLNAESTAPSLVRIIRDIEEYVEVRVQLSSGDAVALLASMPELMSLPSSDADIRQSVATNVRLIVHANLVDHIEEVASRLWEPTITALVTKAMDCTRGAGEWSDRDCESLIGRGLVDHVLESRVVPLMNQLKRRISELDSSHSRSSSERLSAHQMAASRTLNEIQSDIGVLATWVRNAAKVKRFREHSGLPPEFFDI